MAGMISMMRQNQLRFESAAGMTTTEDMNSDLQKKSLRRTHSTAKRILRQPHMMSIAGQYDKPPRRFRKQTCNEIHPLLRRSICTIILAICGLVAGIIQVIVDYHTKKTIVTVTIAVLATSSCVLIIGIAWLWWSSVLLKRYRKKVASVPSNLESQHKPPSDETMWRSRIISESTSASVSKWPTKQTIPNEQVSGSQRESYSSRNELQFEMTGQSTQKKNKDYHLHHGDFPICSKADSCDFEKETTN